MALTLQRAADLARTDTNDTDADAFRVGDTEIARHVNAGLLILFNRAPHLWHGKYDDTPDGEAALADPFPIDPQWMRPLADLVIAMIETKDDEYVLSQRVEAVMNRALGLTVA